MKIGEIARRTGMAASAIRFYEERGLLVSVGRGSNGYRDYTEADIDRLERIKVGKSLGFSLDDLSAFFARGSDASMADIVRSLDARLVEMDQMMDMLAGQRRDLLALKERIIAHWESGQCFKSAQPAAQVKVQATAKGAPRPA